MLAAVLVALPAAAGEYANAKLNYAIALPKGWHVSAETGAETFFGYRNGDYPAAGVGTLPATMSLADAAVVGHIDLSDARVTRDAMIRQAGFPARRIDGAAVAEGEALSFSSIALKPGAGERIIQLTVWGDPKLMSRADISRQVEEMLRSFKPAR